MPFSLNKIFLLILLPSKLICQSLSINYLNNNPGIDDLVDVTELGPDSLLILYRNGTLGTFTSGYDGFPTSALTQLVFDSFEFHGNYFSPNNSPDATAITKDQKILYSKVVPDTVCDYLGAPFFDHQTFSSWNSTGNLEGIFFDSACQLHSYPCSQSIFKGKNGNYFHNSGYRTFDGSGGIDYTHWNTLRSFDDSHGLQSSHEIGGDIFSSGGWLDWAETADNGFILLGYHHGAPIDCGVYLPYTISKFDSTGHESWTAQSDMFFSGYVNNWLNSIDYFSNNDYAAVGAIRNDSISFLYFKNNLSGLGNQIIKVPLIPGSILYNSKFKRVSEETGVILTHESGPAGNQRIGFLKVGISGNLLNYDSYLHDNYCDDFMVVSDTSILFWGNNQNGPFLGVYSLPNLDISSLEGFSEQEIRVFPNPSQDEIRIKGNNLEGEFKIFNPMGIIELQGFLKGMQNEPINIAALDMGTHILIIEREDGTSYRHRFIKL